MKTLLEGSTDYSHEADNDFRRERDIESIKMLNAFLWEDGGPRSDHLTVHSTVTLPRRFPWSKLFSIERTTETRCYYLNNGHIRTDNDGIQVATPILITPDDMFTTEAIPGCSTTYTGIGGSSVSTTFTRRVISEGESTLDIPKKSLRPLDELLEAQQTLALLTDFINEYTSKIIGWHVAEVDDKIAVIGRGAVTNQ